MRVFPLKNNLTPDEVEDKIEASEQELREELLGEAPVPTDRDTIRELGDILDDQVAELDALEDLVDYTHKVTLFPDNITQRKIPLPHKADSSKPVVMKVRGAPNLIYNEDFMLDLSNRDNIYWVGTALEVLLRAGDIVSITYIYKNSEN
jgi:hypothetical protein